MITNAKERAKGVLKNDYLKILGIVVLFSLIFGFFNTSLPRILGFTTEKNIDFMGYSYSLTVNYGTFSTIMSLIVSTISIIPLHYFINLVRGTKITLKESFDFFIKNFLTILLVSVIKNVITSVGYILLIIPGLIAELGLCYAFLYLIDNPDKSFDEIIKSTWNFTKGYKGTILLFALSFIGWYILCLLILPLLYVAPYFQIANVCLYEEIKNTKNVVNEEAVNS